MSSYSFKAVCDGNHEPRLRDMIYDTLQTIHDSDFQFLRITIDDFHIVTCFFRGLEALNKTIMILDLGRGLIDGSSRSSKFR